MDDFKSLESNNMIEFAPKGKNNKNGLALVYAPNGSGKINTMELKQLKLKKCELIKSNLDKYYKDKIDKILKNVVQMIALE